MRTMVAGDLVIDTDRDVSCMVAGDVIVRAPARVRIGGMIAGDLVIEPGASATVTAMVGGTVRGDATMAGMVAGRG